MKKKNVIMVIGKQLHYILFKSVINIYFTVPIYKDANGVFRKSEPFYSHCLKTYVQIKYLLKDILSI